MSDTPPIAVPPGDRILAVTRADREVRLLRLGIATSISLMVVILGMALFGGDASSFGIAMALVGAGAAILIDLSAFPKVYALTDRHVVIRDRTDTQSIPYDRISKVQRWFGALNLTVGTDVVSLEDLREVIFWEAVVRDRTGLREGGD